MAFTHVPVAGDRGFRCHSHVTDDLNDRLYPSDHVANCNVIMLKPCDNSGTCDHIQNWLVKHPLFCSILKQLHDEHVYLIDAFVALAEFKVLLGPPRPVPPKSYCGPLLQAMVPSFWLQQQQ